MKIAFIGPKQYSKSLEMIGFESFEANSEKEAIETIEGLKNKDYGVVFASNDILKKEIEGVVVLPGLVKILDMCFIEKIIKKSICKEIKII